MKCSNTYCHKEAIPGDLYCKKHDGTVKNIKNYNIALKQDNYEQKTTSEKRKDLTEEVALLRIMIEEIWNRCQNTDELIIMFQPLTILIDKTEKLVASMHKMELQSQQYMDQQQMMEFAQKIVEAIDECVSDPQIRSAISKRIENIATETVGNNIKRIEA